MTSLSYAFATLMAKGGTIQAPLLLYGPPTANTEAADKLYVDSSVGGIGEAPQNTTTYGRLNKTWTPVLPLAGGVMTGPITLSGDPVTGLQPATQQYVLAQTVGKYLPVAGGTMAGNLLLNADPTVPLGAVTKQYVDSKVFIDAPLNTNTYGRSNGAWVQVMPLSGGTVTGGISGSGAGQTLDNFNLDMGTF